MAEAVIADLVPLGQQAADQRFVAGNLAADREEGGMGMARAQHRARPGDAVGRRPVVEAEGDQRRIGLDMADRLADQREAARPADLEQGEEGREQERGQSDARERDIPRARPCHAGSPNEPGERLAACMIGCKSPPP